MKIIILDTNIVFSAILNPKSNIGEIIFNNNEQLEFFSTEYLRQEIDRHRDKILKLAKTSEEDVDEVIFQIYKKIDFISDIQIPMRIWAESASLVRDVDIDDLPFVAVTKYLDGVLWTGDLKLLRTLLSKGFLNCITTDELMEWIEKREIEK
ncbi:MAG: PIN domain-containing protein [Chitinophagales bacterium]